jgi:hypothetical protein
MESISMFGTFDPKDPEGAEQFRRQLIPILDQHIRSSLQMIWTALPPDRKTVAELEKEFRRLTDRALANLREDFDVYGMPRTPDNPTQTLP